MNSPFAIKMVLISLSAFAMVIIAGAIVLAFGDRSLPTELWTVLGTCVGAIGAVLSRTGMGTETVTVDNDVDNPIPVENT